MGSNTKWALRLEATHGWDDGYFRSIALAQLKGVSPAIPPKYKSLDTPPSEVDSLPRSNIYRLSYDFRIRIRAWNSDTCIRSLLLPRN